MITTNRKDRKINSKEIVKFKNVVSYHNSLKLQHYSHLSWFIFRGASISKRRPISKDSQVNQILGIIIARISFPGLLDGTNLNKINNKHFNILSFVRNVKVF